MRDFLDNGNENMRNTAGGRGLCIAKEEDDGIGPFVDDQ
jgi:hypothetical protein